MVHFKECHPLGIRFTFFESNACRQGGQIGRSSAGGDRKNRSHERLAKARKQSTRQPNINQTSLNKVEVCRMKTAPHRFSLDTYE